MENKLVPIRALLGELYLASGIYDEALREFEASLKVVPNRFRTIAGAAAAARASGSNTAAKRYYRTLTELAAADGDRREDLPHAELTAGEYCRSQPGAVGAAKCLTRSRA